MMPSMTQILPNLYLGNWNDAYDISSLKLHKITHIVNASDFDNLLPESFTYLRINIEDTKSQNIETYFDYVSNWIDTVINVNKGIVLVHCTAGISRSPTLVIAYLVQKCRMKLNDAILLVRRLRPIVNPNEGFVYQLYKRFSNY